MADEHTEKHNQEQHERAYHIWEREGRPEGRHQEHWDEAERDMGTPAREQPVPASPYEQGKGEAAVTGRDAAVAPKEPSAPDIKPDPFEPTPI